MTIEAELQRSLYARLSAALSAPVHDIAPQDADGGDSSLFPYVTIGRVAMTEGDTKTLTGFWAQMRIHTFSRSGAMLECKTIQGEIYTALHKSELTIYGFNNYSLLREDTDCWPEKDGKIHGVCEYRALIESA